MGDRELQEAADKMMALMRADALFRDANSDAQLKGLQAQLNIDRDKANALGVQIQDIRTALYSTFGERQVSTIYTPTDSYQVILQGADADRMDESAFDKIYVRAQGRRAGAALERRERRAQGRARSRSTTRASCRRSRSRSTWRPARSLGDATEEDRASSSAQTNMPSSHPHRLRRRRGGVPGLADEPGDAARERRCS